MARLRRRNRGESISAAANGDSRVQPLAVNPRPPKPRLKKLRMAIVLLGLSFLAVVSWVFGIMMAVAQDLPALESRAQYDRAQNSVVLDMHGEKLATLTNT